MSDDHAEIDIRFKPVGDGETFKVTAKHGAASLIFKFQPEGGGPEDLELLVDNAVAILNAAAQAALKATEEDS